jgi:hypothetical protein
MRGTEESGIFFSSSCSSRPSWFRFQDACENDKMLCLLEQKDESTPLIKMALTLCALSLCGEDSCETKPISRLRVSGTTPGNRRPPSAELSDCGSCETNPIPDRRDTPAFHCSIIPPFRADANCAKQSQSGPLAARRACETNPSWPNWQAGRGLGGRNVRNEPNSVRLAGRVAAEWKCAKQTQSPEAGHRGGVSIADFGLRIGDSKTNPIWPNWQTGRGLGGRDVRNKPNSARLHPATGWNGAKQTQFERPGSIQGNSEDGRTDEE